MRELARAKVAVVPVLAGSGTRLKILEAWAAGVPVVSTTLGAEGLGGARRRKPAAGGWRAGIRGGGLAAIGVSGASGEGGCGWQAIAGRGVYLGNGVEEVGFLTQQVGEIM